jgi:hypothetical protein
LADDAVISEFSPNVIEISDAAVRSVNSGTALRLNSGLLSLGDGKSSCPDGFTLNGGTFDLSATAYVDQSAINGPGELVVPANEVWQFDGCTINVPVTNHGTLTITGDVISPKRPLVNAAGALLRIDSNGFSGSLRVFHGVTNLGRIELDFDSSGQSTLYATGGTLLNDVGATIKVTDAVGYGAIRGQIDNRGLIEFDSTGDLWYAGTSRNQGSISCSGDVNFQNIGLATFTNAGDWTIDSGFTVTGQLYVVNYESGNIGGSGTLLLVGGSFNLINDFVVDVPIRITGSARINGPGKLINPIGHEIDFYGGLETFLNAAVHNEGTWLFTASGQINGAVTTTSTSLMRFQTSPSTSVNPKFGAGFTNHGRMELPGSRPISITVNSGVLVNGPTGTILCEGESLRQLNSQFDNRGELIVDRSMSVSVGTLLNSGRIDVAAGQTLLISNGDLDCSPTGILTGAGTYHAFFQVKVAGSIQPGASTASLSLFSLVNLTGSLVIDINGPTPGSEFDQIVSSRLQVSGVLNANVNYQVPVGQSLIIWNNLNPGFPTTGAFVGLPEGTVFMADGQHFQISYQAGAGNNDVQLTRVAPPTVSSVQVNDNSSQRSKVTSLTVTFDSVVNFAGAVANAFTLARNGGGAVNFQATTSIVNGVTVVTLNNFTGPETQFDSLRDGRFTLTAIASEISNALGQLNGGNNYIFGDAQGLFRMFGDFNGDRQVDGFDFGAFSSTFNLTSQQAGFLAMFDINGDGQIDGFDFGQFSGRFNTVLP